MTRLVVAAALLVTTFTANVAVGQVDIFYSTSNVDAFAGTVLDLELGTSGSMYVWLTNNDQAVIDGVGIDLLSDDAAILEATMHEIFNPSNRWAVGGINNGMNGDLNTGSIAFALPGLGAGTGIANNNTPVLYSQITFDATAVGTTGLTIVQNAGAISVSGNVPQSLTFGPATVNVFAPVPEPTAAVLSLVGIGLACIRRRAAN